MRLTTEPAERGLTAFTGDFVLKPGETHTLTLRYRLPSTVATQPYRLFVRKQAGTTPWPLTVRYDGCHEQTTLATDFHFSCLPTGAP